MTDLTRVPWREFPQDASPRAQVTRNFRLFELSKSELADRNQIDNHFPDEDTLRAAVYLCRTVMQPVRDAFGSYTPNSVFRSQALERALKRKDESWTRASQHTKGEACDIEVPGRANRELAEWIKDNLAFDQLILECYNPAKGPNSGWVHVSVKPPGRGENRNQVLSYIYSRANRRFIYVQGLTDNV